MERDEILSSFEMDGAAGAASLSLGGAHSGGGAAAAAAPRAGREPEGAETEPDSSVADRVRKVLLPY